MSRVLNRSLASLIVLCFYQSYWAQDTRPELPLPLSVQQAREAVRKLLADSGHSFKEGMVAFKENNREKSGVAFNRSVEIFLLSSLDIQRDQTLQTCYSQLIETIYRLEFPSINQPPQIRSLSATCNWNWNEADMKLADVAVALAIQKKAFPAVANSNSASADPKQTASDSVDGFNQQRFEPSPFDDLSKLRLTTDELHVEGDPVKGDDWQTISKRTGVSVADLMAANPGMKVPKGNVFVPLDRILAGSPTFWRPQSESPQMRPGRIVKAQAGDTVARLAARNGADPTEVAKYNGLLPNSSLGAGREIIIIPSSSVNDQLSKVILIPVSTASRERYRNIPTPVIPIGPKPTKLKDGRVSVVMRYFYEVLHDPYSMRIVKWSPISASSSAGDPCWRVSVRYRAKNLMGAYVLSERSFCIRNNRIVSTYE